MLAWGGLQSQRASAQRLKLPVPTAELRRQAGVDSADAAAHYNYGLGLLAEKKYVEAEKEFRLSVGLDPRFAVGYLTLAYLPFAQEKRLWDWYFEEAVPAAWKARVEESDRLYRRAFMIDPLVDLRIIGAVLPPRSAAWLSSEELIEIYDQFLHGYDNLYSGDYAGAHLRLQRLIQDYRDSGARTYVPSALRWYFALAAGHLGRFDEAADVMQSLLDDALKEQRRRREALGYLPLAAQDYRYNLARMTELRGDTARAASLYREAAEADLGLYMAHVRLAAIYEAMGQWDAAVGERRTALDSNPDDSSLMLDLGATLTRAQRLPEAETALRQATQANPRDPRAHYMLGVVAAARGDTAAAREALQRSIDLAPSRMGALRELARRRLAALQ